MASGTEQVLKAWLLHEWMKEWRNECNFPSIYFNPSHCLWSWIIFSSGYQSDRPKLAGCLSYKESQRSLRKSFSQVEKLRPNTLQGHDLEKWVSPAFRWETLNKSQFNSLIQQSHWICFPIHKTGIIKFALPTSKNSIPSFNIYWELTRCQALCQGPKI